MKSLCFRSVAPPIRSSSPFLSRISLKIPPSLNASLSPKRCGGFVPMCFSNPEKPSTPGELLSRASISVLDDQSINNFKSLVGNTVSPRLFNNPLAKLSLSDQVFLLLAFIVCTTSVAFTSFVISAVPTLLAMGRAASSFAKLADTARKELPSTLEAIRLSGMEISDLTLELSDLSQDITDGINKSAKAVQAAEAGIRQIGTLAHQQTLSMIEERANLPEISLRPVVAGAAQKASHAMGRATKRLRNIITGGDKDEDSFDV